MATTYLNRTPTTENINKLTLSCWVKRSSISNNSQRIFSNPSSEYLFHRFETNDQFRFTIVVDGSETTLRTNRVFRDTSAWYHIVVRWDTTQATEADRIKLWVNGVQETSFNLATYPALNSNSDMFNSGTVFEIGRYSTGNNEYFDGSMSHLHCCSGYAYDADTFGETDSLTGIWKPKTAPSVTYGTNGFFLKFENSGAFGTDSSGNGNTFTVNGTMTQNIDTPSNVFATLNPLDVTADDEGTYSNGNTTASGDGSFHQFRSTFYLTTGKYYWEFKPTTVGDACQGGVVGSNYAGGSGLRRNYSKNGQKYTDGSGSSYGATYTVNDIIGVALNLDDGQLTFYKNGVSQGVAYTDMLSAIGQDGWTPDLILYNSTVNVNYGNGYFGTTAVSSAQNPDDGIGIFEYDVPTGYYALNTKAINAQEYD